MGGSASKPRKLTNTIQATEKAVNRSAINQLPSKGLKEQYEKNILQAELNRQNPQPTPDESLNQTSSHASPFKTAGFDASKLKKKLNTGVSKHNQNHTLPEGKDGYDPHEAGTSTYDNQFVSSINNLGRQIQSHTPQHGTEASSLALRQLKHRKQVFEAGEKELKSQMDQIPDDGVEGSKLRTMVHPRTLGAILNDIRDPRVDDKGIVLDYSLHPSFLPTLGKRFKVANNTVIIEEKTKDDELGHRIVPPSKISDSYEDAEFGEAIDSERYKKLKGRISLE